MIKKSFEQCYWEELTQLFGLEKVKNLNSLSELFSSGVQIKPELKKDLIKLNTLLLDHFLDWNEDELKMQFISPLLYLVDYNDSDRYQPFSQRILQMQSEEIELSGIVDWVLASGKQFPKEPFFFLHEYKREKGTANDPLGQLLAAMLSAQYQNKDPKRTLYGCYIMGKDWYFVGLEGKQYQTTLPYNTTDYPTLEKVYHILSQIKNLILK